MVSERAPISSVEVVREELKRLGYLDRGLDRFVLSAAEGPSPSRACFAAAGRVGLAGGVLFGLAGSFAAVGLDRRLLAEPRDLAVLALYLIAGAGLTVGSLALAAGFVAAWAGRRLARRPGPALARNVGLVLAITGLLYLSSWWRSHLASAPLPGQALALALGVGLSLTLGRFGSLAAVAVLAAGGVGDRLPRAVLSRQYLGPVLAAAALLYGGGAVAAAYFGRAAVAPGPDFAVLPTGVRVRVLGIDGFERGMTEHLLARGELPRLEALASRAARGRLRPEPERVPAIVWTTIATGRGPEAHGILSAGARRLTGIRTPVTLDTSASPFVSALGAAAELLRLTRTEPTSSVLRSVKAFWNVASEKGLRVGVVNWWATWPADPVNGYLVSDRAYFKLERGGPFDREVWPKEAFARLGPLLAPTAGEERARRLDRFEVDASRVLRDERPPDLEALYLSGLDIYTSQKLGETAATSLATLDERLQEVRDYYRFLDGLIGEAAAFLGPADVLVLVGDPGRRARGEPGAEGTFLMLGGPIRKGELGLVSSRDVAPTVLHLVGIPRSRELEGRVIEEALEPGFRAAHPLRTVASYGRRSALPPAESAFDPEMLEELKSLGYIQ